MNLIKRYIVRRTNRWLARLGASPLAAACPGDAGGCPIREALMATGRWSAVGVDGWRVTGRGKRGRREVVPLPVAASLFVWLLDHGHLPEFDATRQTGWSESGDNVGGPAPEAGGDDIWAPEAGGEFVGPYAERDIELAPVTLAMIAKTFDVPEELIGDVDPYDESDIEPFNRAREPADVTWPADGEPWRSIVHEDGTVEHEPAGVA